MSLPDRKRIRTPSPAGDLDIVRMRKSSASKLLNWGVSLGEMWGSITFGAEHPHTHKLALIHMGMGQNKNHQKTTCFYQSVSRPFFSRSEARGPPEQVVGRPISSDWDLPLAPSRVGHIRVDWSSPGVSCLFHDKPKKEMKPALPQTAIACVHLPAFLPIFDPQPRVNIVQPIRSPDPICGFDRPGTCGEC